MDIASIGLTVIAVAAIQIAGRAATVRRLKQRVGLFQELADVMTTNLTMVAQAKVPVAYRSYFDVFQRTFPGVYGRIRTVVDDAAVADQITVDTYMEMFKDVAELNSAEFDRRLLVAAERHANQFIAARDSSPMSRKKIEEQLRAIIGDWEFAAGATSRGPGGTALGQP